MVDFKTLGAQLLAQAPALLVAWFPAGRMEGHEFKIGNLAGEPGQSLSVNTLTGVWSDFAQPGLGGNDLIALYAAIHNLKMSEAAAALSGVSGSAVTAPTRSRRPEVVPVRPNGHSETYTGFHVKHGVPADSYPYTDAAGELLFYVARYEREGKKTFAPWVFDGQRWVMRAWPAPRPLYGLAQLTRHRDCPVLVVEGEKCADAAAEVIGNVWVVVSWAQGANAVSATDWAPLADRQVAIWPDADEPGRRAALEIARALGGKAHVLDVPLDKPGYDVADLIADGADAQAVLAFIKDHRPRPAAHVVSSAPVKREQAREVEAALPVFTGERHAWEHFALSLGPGGRPWANMETAERVISQHPDTRDDIWYDEFGDCVMLGERQFNEERDGPDLLIVLQRQICLGKMSSGPLLEAVGNYARSRARHPVREWLKALPSWDGEERLEQLMALGFGTTQDDYHAAIGRNLVVAMAARVLDPGCKHDYMPVLEGAEGIGKSTALQVLGEPWYGQNHERMVGKDFLQNLPGVWLVEINELESFSGSSQEKIKGIISDPSDRYRQSYGRRAHAHPRQCVFAGSTNSRDWNHSDTGARRFWPVKCGNVDLMWLRENRTQLFAQALNHYQAGEPWWMVPIDQALAEQELRRVDDPWAITIERSLTGRTQYTVEDAWIALEIKAQDRSLKDARRIGRVLRLLGFEPKTERISYGTQKVYRPKPK